MLYGVGVEVIGIFVFNRDKVGRCEVFIVLILFLIWLGIDEKILVNIIEEGKKLMVIVDFVFIKVIEDFLNRTILVG